MRPTALTLMVADPTVSFIPTQPPKSLRTGRPLTEYPVTNAVPVAPPVPPPGRAWKFAVTVCDAVMLTVCGFVLPLMSPVQPAKL